MQRQPTTPQLPDLRVLVMKHYMASPSVRQSLGFRVQGLVHDESLYGVTQLDPLVASSAKNPKAGHSYCCTCCHGATQETVIVKISR